MFVARGGAEQQGRGGEAASAALARSSTRWRLCRRSGLQSFSVGGCTAMIPTQPLRDEGAESRTWATSDRGLSPSQKGTNPASSWARPYSFCRYVHFFRSGPFLNNSSQAEQQFCGPATSRSQLCVTFRLRCWCAILQRTTEGKGTNPLECREASCTTSKTVPWL